jgi:hypothetical protein
MTVLSLGLLGGAAAAFAVAESLKLERLPIVGPRFTAQFSPVCDCATSVAKLSLRSRFPDQMDAEIVDRNGNPVRTLAENRRIGRGRFALRWDGTDDEGAIVPDGAYRLRLELRQNDRTILVPDLIRVDTAPPRVRLLRVVTKTISPDGDRRADRARLLYRATNPAGPILVVDGVMGDELVLRPKRGRVLWDGTVSGRVLPGGPHELALRVRDRAGNLSEPTRTVVVRIRYVELDRQSYTARRGALLRFRAARDAHIVRWKLRRPNGALVLSGTSKRSTVSVPLPTRVRPGLYRLVVAVGSHRDDALVRVERALRRGGAR